VICGDGPERAHLEDEAARLGLQDRVRFTGFIHPHDVPAVLQMADVFVMPSLYEEFGMALLEAMAMERPIVATATGGICELLEHRRSGLLVTPGSPEALSDAIEELLLCPDLANRLGRAAHADALPYDIDHTAEAMFDLYCQVTRGLTYRKNKKPF
jgi:glycogen(starch) synthase